MVDAFGEGQSSLGCFDHAELVAWAASGASDKVLVDDMRTFLRAQFLCATIGATFGPDVERGLIGAEAIAALALAARPSRDWHQHGAKRSALLSRASLRSSTDLVSAMVRVALDHDEQRLALSAASAFGTAGRRRRPLGPPPTECESALGLAPLPTRTKHIEPRDKSSLGWGNDRRRS